jgi:hypothetical protein
MSKSTKTTQIEIPEIRDTVGAHYHTTCKADNPKIGTVCKLVMKGKDEALLTVRHIQDIKSGGYGVWAFAMKGEGVKIAKHRGEPAILHVGVEAPPEAPKTPKAPKTAPKAPKGKEKAPKTAKKAKTVKIASLPTTPASPETPASK